MQESLKRFTIARGGKAVIIRNYWDKMYQKLMLAATKDRDEELLKMLKKIYAVKDSVREVGINHYIYKCQKLYEISFY